MLLPPDSRLFRYVVMAATIVLIEISVFQIIYWITHHYQLSTIISFIVAVILNWVGGRIFVFGKSKHSSHREFTMILIASIVGLIIQLTVVTILVEYFFVYPLIAKGASILFSFFWNYWFRTVVVYAKK